ncbi:DUF3499 domain-containing protein [Corynebacterium gerontici]|uniref:DUF3499 domain-containing protein n=1 Tax=Corynebacterium gerontici TaxID=2079234 RepID=UPI0013DE14F4|nr:DUF3499 domain-containing protein [Corynebacterium gerontici]
MNHYRRCSRPGCGKPAVATLTYAYAQSTAVVGPLATSSDPHSWDLCEHHASKITAPLGWELLRVDALEEDDEDLTALAEAVRQAGRSSIEQPTLGQSEHVGQNHPVHKARRKATRRAHLQVVHDADKQQ